MPKKKEKKQSIRLSGKYATAYQGPEVIVKEGTGQSGGVAVPRYDKGNFKATATPNSKGLIKQHNGARLFENGIVRYPYGVDVDPVRAAKIQALADYNGSPGRTPQHREEMAKIYGQPYLDEFARLGRVKNY